MLVVKKLLMRNKILGDMDWVESISEAKLKKEGSRWFCVITVVPE